MPNENGVVHPQSRDCGAADIAQRQDSQVVVAPVEVLMPGVSPRVEEPDLEFVERLLAGGEVPLQAVAVRTGRGEIFQIVEVLARDRVSRVPSARRARDDVVDLELPSLDSAILAAIAGAPPDGLLVPIGQRHLLA